LFDSHDEDNHELKDKLITSHIKAMAPSNNEVYSNEADYDDDNLEPKDKPKTSHKKALALSNYEGYFNDVEHTAMFKFHSVGIFPPSTDVLDFPTDIIGQFDGNESVASITEPSVGPAMGMSIFSASYK
jgi:hypothetical protein